MNWFFLFLAFLIGTFNTLQSGTNAQLRESLGNPILAAIGSFTVGLIVLIIVFICFNESPVPTLADVKQIHWTRFMGGVLGSCYVITVIFIIRDIGPANMICLVVAGQMIAAMTVDHFGFQGFAVHTISWPRIAGTVLLVAGVYLILKN